MIPYGLGFAGFYKGSFRVLSSVIVIFYKAVGFRVHELGSLGLIRLWFLGLEKEGGFWVSGIKRP